ncbi:MAG: hypothetical protein KDK39_14800 [Leptospiraceae bacterium]|nr:hypothetical protein [Leptospiraceae bacterium]
MVWTTNTEQGYAALSNSDSTRELVNLAGLTVTRFRGTGQITDVAQIEPQGSARHPQKLSF